MEALTESIVFPNTKIIVVVVVVVVVVECYCFFLIIIDEAPEMPRCALACAPCAF